MLNNTPQIRKAAVLLRSLDVDTATALLAQLSTDEAQAVRAAIRSLGPIDPEEQADVAAEFRRAAPTVVDGGVELRFTTDATEPDGSSQRRFVFLEQAPIDALVPCLAREHVQTIAVVLSYLRPTRAAEVLAALPSRLQAETLERLTTLGQSDPDSLTVLERELAAWLTSQQARQSRRACRTDAVAAILAAARQTARRGILANLRQHNNRLAEDISRRLPESSQPRDTPTLLGRESPVGGLSGADEGLNRRMRSASETPPTRDTYMTPTRARCMALASDTPPTQGLSFDDLARLGTESLSAVLQQVDANVLVLALAGSSDELVDQVTGRMPRKVAKTFRRQLRQLGPTRLSDVEAAQAAVAAVATRLLHAHRHPSSVAA